MNTTIAVRTRAIAFITIAAVSGLVLGGCDKLESKRDTASSGVTTQNLADKVDQASTPADHEALAQYYDEQARLAQREVAEEQEARTRYERRWNSDDHSMGRGPREHFSHMIEGREGSANDYRAMAEWHREMATRAGRDERTDE